MYTSQKWKTYLVCGEGLRQKAVLLWIFEWCRSIADPFNFDTDPGSENIRYGSGSRPNFDTDSDPGKKDTDPDLKKVGKNAHFLCIVC